MNEITLSETLYTVANLQGTEGQATPRELRDLAGDAEKLEAIEKSYAQAYTDSKPGPD